MEDSKHPGLDGYARNVIRHAARKLIGRFGFKADDYEDLMQELALDLLIRLPKFDPTKATQNTFIAQTVTRAVSNLVRHRHRQKRDYRRESTSFDGEARAKNGDSIDWNEALSQDEIDLRTGRHNRPEEERLDLRLDVSIAISQLPPGLKALAELLKTSSITDAAQALGTSRSTVYEARIPRIRKAFADKGLSSLL